MADNDDALVERVAQEMWEAVMLDKAAAIRALIKP